MDASTLRGPCRNLLALIGPPSWKQTYRIVSYPIVPYRTVPCRTVTQAQHIVACHSISERTIRQHSTAT